MSEFRSIEGSTVIEVDKVGGGTFGKSYEGDWEVSVYESGTMVLNDIIRTNTPYSHREVSELALEFMDDADVID